MAPEHPSEPVRGSAPGVAPGAVPASAPRTAPTESAAPEPRAAAALLVLEDDPGILLLERRALERAGYKVLPASDAEQAAAAVRRCTPDLLVLDYNLNTPRTGLDFYRSLRVGGLDCPAILVTGFSDEGRAIEALRAGFRDVVPKVGGYLDYLPEAVGRVLAQVQDARRLAETEAENRAKDHFLAVLSHELRTPLSPVLSAVQLLDSHPGLPPELREPLEAIRRNVELEVKLIDDLLDLTRVSRGKVELRLVPIDVHEMLRNAVQVVEADVKAKRLALRTEWCARRPTVRGDAARLQQVFWNLLKNAVKFTPERGSVTVRTGDTPEGRLRLEVQDTGVGIDPEVLPRIFNAFEQGGKDVTRAFGGLGLGLSICKGLVELHGGTITAHSAGKGRGATFTVELPAAPAEAPCPAGPTAPVEKAPTKPQAPCAAGAAGTARQGVRVLLVEDNADTAKLMAHLLRGYGHRVAVADSVSTALRTADAERFDVVVSDIGLPDGTGFDLMRQLLSREQPKAGGIKGIALSGFGMEEDLRMSREAGFVQHLTKPIDPRRLHDVIHKVTSGV